MQTRFYEDSSFGKSDRRFYEDRLRSGRVTTASGLVLDLAVVADGIGGENAGERAAEMAVDEVFAYASASPESNIPLLLQTALECANAKVFQEAQGEKHKQDMGSTAVVAAIHKGRLYVANVGDSRIYLVRGRDIKQLTRDHTFANEVVLQGKLTPLEASQNIHRDDLVRSVGFEAQVMVDTGLYLNQELSEEKAREQQGLPLKPGDRVILCSDGLFKARRKGGRCFVEPREMVQILSDALPEEGARLLVDKALERGTDDNVSVIVMDIPARFRPVLFPRPARIAFIGMLTLGLLGLGLFLPVLRRPPIAPTLPPVQISEEQAYIAEVKELSLDFIASTGEERSVLNDEFVDFMPGAILRTSPAQSGYVLVGLPGRAELFMAPGSQVRLISSDASGVSIQLQAGRAILKLQDDFPEGRRLTVFSSGWANTWISASSMCLWYEAETQIFNLECVEDRCGYLDHGEKYISAGYHVEFKGDVLSGMHAGVNPAMCQFVPGLVPTPTPTPTATQRQALIKPLLNITATGGEPPFFPPSPTFEPPPTWIPPPTLTSEPPTPEITDTIPAPPTDTLEPSPTEEPTATPIPTDTDTPFPSETPTLSNADGNLTPTFSGLDASFESQSD